MPRSSRAAAVPPRTRSRVAVTRARTVTPRRVSRVVVKKAPSVIPLVDEALRGEHLLDPVEMLIRKHAPARAACAAERPSILYYLAAAVVVTLVIFGWWLTLDRNLQAQRGQEDLTPGVTDILQGGVTQLRNGESIVPLVTPPEPKTP